MHLLALAWIYVVLMMAVAEALSPVGSVLGALITFFLYGVLPLSIVLYVLGTPGRKRARKLAEAAELQAASAPGDGDGSGHAAGAGLAPERKEP